MYRILVQLPGLYASGSNFAETDSASIEVGAPVFIVDVQHSAMEIAAVHSESGQALLISIVETLLESRLYTTFERI